MKTSVIMRPIAVVVLPILIVSLAVSLGLAMVDAGASDPSNTRIVVPLPESDVAVQTGADGLCEFTGTDLQYVGQTGEPSLPCQSITVLLPPDADLTTVKATVIGYEWIKTGGDCDVRPVPPVAVQDCQEPSAPWPADSSIVDGRDTDIYGSATLFPLEPVRKVDVQVLRGWNMVQILYAPFACNPVEKQVFRLSGKAIEITFERTSLKTGAAGVDLTSTYEVRDMTVNFAEVSGEYGGYAVSADTGRYVIITTSAIQAASANLDDFVASKEARGFTVQVVTEGTWGGGTGNTAAENIRAWLQANYIDLGIKYVLLIGNPNPTSGTVPMKMCYPQAADSRFPDCPTDFYYAELTSNDWDKDGDGKYGEYYNDFSGNPPRAAEVAVGRIPYYGSTTDLDNILAKITAYENAAETDISWHRNVLLPMEPSDALTPGYQLGEEIKDDILVPSGWTYHRVYDDDYGLTPSPETTSCTVSNVTNAWNGSDFGAIFWWTHGSSTSAADIMDLSHAATLDDAHPGFTFQCSCTNGMPEVTNNLGYSLLKNGCIATVSASRVSWYWVGQTSFAKSSSNSGMTFEYAERLVAEEMYAGDALNGVRMDVPTEHEVMWMNYLDFNLYGCPAVGIPTPPLIGTTEATDTAPSSAQLNGTLSSLGTAENVTVSFEWGLDSGYGNETTSQTLTSSGSFSAVIDGLTPETTYHFRAKAIGYGTVYGDDMTFAADEAVTFPDSNLEAAIREALGKPSGAIYQFELSSLGDFSAFERGIVELTGLEHCTNLTTLSLDGNMISNISPLAGLTKLIYLGLEGNQISNIEPLSGLTTLHYVNLTTNEISDIEPLVDNQGIGSGDIVGLALNPLSCLSRSGYVPELRGRGVNVGLIGEPDQPINISPADGADVVGLTLVLQSSAFSPCDPCDTHVASQWQITITAGDYSDPAFDRVDTSNLTSFTVYPTNTSFDVLLELAIPATCYWRVRHQDNLGEWSSWSTETSFNTINRLPNQPTNQSPSDGAVGVDLAPTLESSAFADPDPYHYYQVASQWQITTTAGDYSSPIFDSGTDYSNLTSINIPAGTLDYLTAYFWRVRHQDRNYDWSEWSAETSFVTKPPPARPWRSSPPHGYQTEDTTPSFDWSSVSDPAGVTYWLQIAYDYGFTSLVLDKDGLATSDYTLSELEALADGKYYWRVCAVDGLGHQSAWTSGWGITVDTAAPARPWRSSPPHGYQTEDTTPSFDWSNVSDPTGVTYWLQIAYDYGFSSLALDKDGLGTSDYTLAELEALADGKYYWRVCAVDGLGHQSTWTSGWGITVDTAAPARPWRSSPPHGFETDDTTPSFDWSNVSDPSGVTYWLQIASDYGFTSLVLDKDGLTVSEYTLDELEALADGKYYWRVCAVDGLGHQSAWTSGWAITVDTTAPAKPWRSAPPHGYTTDDTTPSFDWSNVSDPTGVTYRLQIAYDYGFSSLALDKDGLVTSDYTLAEVEALADGTYYWRVCAVDGLGHQSIWTSGWSLTVAT
ncbi:MAG: leucine-rich repeat domain-containing protein [Dehalococcoidia bacterium]|nr:leucine-rich repeat domain-containing protein [Dehalococcoidia bacterium]